MARKKKKPVHWSKLPRTKLIAMVKRLQSDKTKLELRLSQARETRLLNDYGRETATGAVLYVRDVDGTGSLHPCARGDNGAIAYVPAEAFPPSVLEDFAGVVHVTQEPRATTEETLQMLRDEPTLEYGPFPWERE